MFSVSELGSEKFQKNKNYLEDILLKNPGIYDNIILGEDTLIEKLEEIFPFNFSITQRIKNLINPQNISRNSYLTQFAVLLDGLELTTETDDEKFNSIYNMYTQRFGSHDKIPDSVFLEEKENFFFMDEIDFLGGDEVVYDLDFEDERKSLIEDNFFSNSGKHFLGIGTVGLLLNSVEYSPFYNSTSAMFVASSCFSLFALRGLLHVCYPKISQDYLSLLKKVERADIFMEEVFKS